MNPRVSVVVTVFNRTEYLAKAVASVMAQSFTNYEVLVADDSGKALSADIVATFNESERIRYLANPASVGVALSIRQAVGQARGEFVAILNDDDVWERDFLAELTPPLFDDSDRVAAFSDYWFMDENGRIDSKLTDLFSANFGRLMMPEGVVHDPEHFAVIKEGIPIANAALFRKDAFDWTLVTRELAGAYDYWIACLLVVSGRPIYYVPRRLSRYRVHREMETYRRSHDKAENLIYIFTTIRERGWFSQLDSAIKHKLADALLLVAREKLHFRRLKESRHLFWKCFRMNFHPLALVGVVGTFLPRAIRKRLWSVFLAIGRAIWPRQVLGVDLRQS